VAWNPLCKYTSYPPLPSCSFHYAFRCQIVKPTATMVANSTVGLTTTLEPLPPVLRHGLVAVAFFGLLSLISSVALFTFLTYRLAVWFYQGRLRDGANQFLLLIYNLVLADIQQAMAFALTSVYLSQDKIEVGSTTCWANGWFVSTGDLASGVFIFAIALHTYVSVVRGQRVGNKTFFGGIACMWIFVYLMAIIGVGLDPKIYQRAGAWVRLCAIFPVIETHPTCSAGSTKSMTRNDYGCTISGSSSACLARS
jgi:hypothetical protein